MKNFSKWGKPRFYLVLGIVLIIVSSMVYVFSGSAIRKERLLSYLEDRDYSRSELHSVNIEYSLGAHILGYVEWTASVEFNNERGIKYHYSFIGPEIHQGGFSTDEKLFENLEKDEILEMLINLEDNSKN